QQILFVLRALLIERSLVYCNPGQEFSLTLSDRVFASYRPQILSVATGVSAYSLFILQSKSIVTRCQVFLMLLLGFVGATFRFLLYHGYFQYQNGFWKKKNVQSKILYFNSSENSETIKIVEYQLNEESKSDTVFSKQITPYFEIQNPVKIEKG